MNIFKNLFHHNNNNNDNTKEEITMTNKDKVLALINTFATGDTEAASKAVA